MYVPIKTQTHTHTHTQLHTWIRFQVARTTKSTSRLGKTRNVTALPLARTSAASCAWPPMHHRRCNIDSARQLTIKNYGANACESTITTAHKHCPPTKRKPLDVRGIKY